MQFCNYKESINLDKLGNGFEPSFLLVHFNKAPHLLVNKGIRTVTTIPSSQLFQESGSPPGRPPEEIEGSDGILE